MEKVAFMKAFPNLLQGWEELRGKTVEAVAPLKGKAGSAALIFTDGTLLIAPPPATEPFELGEALQAARPQLQPRQPAWYEEYDRLVQKDKDAMRSARLEKILGAIQNNLEQIPELKDRLKDLVKEWK
ncbi:MAG: hypothetical protein U0361_08960 [Nitrospiraceae bacterium]